MTGHGAACASTRSDPSRVLLLTAVVCHVQMLCHFLRAEALHPLVRPFMRSIVASLPLQSNARLAAVALEALGEPYLYTT